MSCQTALLVHSGGFTSRQWRRLSEALAPNYRVLAPDLLGYGAGEPWPDGKPFHFRQDLAFLESLIADEGEPVHLVGHSYGGFLVLQLALLRPDLVRSIAVYDPVAFGILDEVEDADVRSTIEPVRRAWKADSGGADEAWLAAFVVYGLLSVLLPPTPFLFSHRDQTVAYVGFAVVAALLMAPAVFGDRACGLPRRVLAQPVVAWLGLISYGIFLWHYAVVLRLGVPGSGLDFWPLLGVTLAIAVACATVSYYVLEKPLLRFKYRSSEQTQSTVERSRGDS